MVYDVNDGVDKIQSNVWLVANCSSIIMGGILHEILRILLVPNIPHVLIRELKGNCELSSRKVFCFQSKNRRQKILYLCENLLGDENDAGTWQKM